MAGDAAAGTVRGEVLGIPHLPKTGRYGAPIICLRERVLRERGSWKRVIRAVNQERSRLIQWLFNGSRGSVLPGCERPAAGCVLPSRERLRPGSAAHLLPEQICSV
jgi:hypothetical protein